MHIYLGTFLIALATLGLEITLARFLSVVTWYHLAFFAISTAMLGMTAGATTVFLQPKRFDREQLEGAIARACLEFGLVVPVSMAVLCFLPLSSERSALDFLFLLVATAVCSIPFYFAGIAVTAVLTKHDLPVGRIYGSDLLGAAAGCLLVVVGLEFFDAPTLILLFAAIGCVAAMSFARRLARSKLRHNARAGFVVLIVAAGLNSLILGGIQPLYIKGRYATPSQYEVEEWNSLSRVVVFGEVEAKPHLWGPSPVTPEFLVRQRPMNIDGEAATVLGGYESEAEIEYLRFDVTNVAYTLRPSGGACIIGVGGGRDIQSALLFGQEPVTGVDVNPIFIDLLENRFRDFAGVADREGVELVTAEARSFLTHNDEKFAVIQMSLTDTWAATGAGAFSLSENSLYTVEAWQVFLNRLTANGVFTSSRWYSPEDLGETGRLVSLGVSSLLRAGVARPAENLAMVTSGTVATLMLSPTPFSRADRQTLRQIVKELEFKLDIDPGMLPDDPLLRSMLEATSLEGLEQAISQEPLNYAAPRDENPYFFNMLRLGHLGQIHAHAGGVIEGNMVAIWTLLQLILCLVIFSIGTVVLPLWLGGRTDPDRRLRREVWAGALYFCLIGAGFMLLEIALIQRLAVFLGHPVYALSVLLFTIILGAGCGSLLSERIPISRPIWIFGLPLLTAAAILLIKILLGLLTREFITLGMPQKILLSMLCIGPMGLLMGTFLPIGLALSRRSMSSQTPWFWALNGIVGVLCSALAVFFAIYFGISVNFYLAAICYAALVLAIPSLRRGAQFESVPRRDRIHATDPSGIK
jgi:hypothetical protein